jgi:DNA invertase Pin-like site-specific DNA recombinase
MPSREDQIQLALADYESGKITSQKALAKMYDIPRSTLRDRIKSKKQPRESYESQQGLSAI